MKYSGKARKAAFKLIMLSLIAGVVIWVLLFFGTLLATVLMTIAVPVLVVGWIIFSIFTLYFFRDPRAHPPAGPGLVLSPGHGKVDVIDTVSEPLFVGGPCQRISIFLSVFDVHVQNAPVSGKVAFFKYTMGEFINALKAESALYNENVFLGFEASDPAQTRIGMRLIAGVIARRIVPFVQQGEVVERGQRISLIQFGSRVDVFLPLNARIKVKVGDRVVGGSTILAAFE